MRVTYNNRTWEARWWTQNQAPGTNEVWLDRGGQQPAWTPGTFYPTGALVSYQGRIYQCRQGQTAQVGWEPPTTLALWLPV